MSALGVAAQATGWNCGKRLVAALPALVPALDAEGALRLGEEKRAALGTISAATIDRLLRPARQGPEPKGLATTEPGSLLKRQVPMRTYTPWDEQRGGLPLHTECGGSRERLHRVRGPGQQGAGDRLYRHTAGADAAAVVLLGLDSDNGSDFINTLLIQYCEQERITLTRCRVHHKNDQAHVEATNFAVVRQLVGDDR